MRCLPAGSGQPRADGEQSRHARHWPHTTRRGRCVEPASDDERPSASPGGRFWPVEGQNVMAGCTACVTKHGLGCSASTTRWLRGVMFDAHEGVIGVSVRPGPGVSSGAGAGTRRNPATGSAKLPVNCRRSASFGVRCGAMMKRRRRQMLRRNPIDTGCWRHDHGEADTQVVGPCCGRGSRHRRRGRGARRGRQGTDVAAGCQRSEVASRCTRSSSASLCCRCAPAS